MTTFIKEKLNKRSLLLLVIVFGLIAIFLSQFSFANKIEENDVRVKENSELTYYLDVIYDGKDSNVITSSDTATAEVRSDIIHVSDKIPEGLTFKRFITSDDGTIGAVKRSDGSSCPGYVVNDAAGLKYDENTRTVSFDVKNLKAGCKLTVGIVTQTPYLDDYGVDRMDFYNTGHANENDTSINSNTVHAYIGREDMTDYVVSYSYTGTIPPNAPNAPGNASYIAGVTVGVEAEPKVPGYTFSGWKTEEVIVTNGKFSMPEKNVIFVGSFTENPAYDVTYVVNGAAPENFKSPSKKTYNVGVDVKVDSLKVGDIVDGYRFLGWKPKEDIDISTGEFQMPNKNVELVGQFERVKYTVTYEFQGSIRPTNESSILPKPNSYYPGDTVTVENNIPSTTCKVDGSDTVKKCTFLGWYKDTTFEMPEKDVIIYGEWKITDGLFSPTIMKDLVDNRSSYQNGEEIKFKITVVNTENYPIHDVLLQEELDGVTFINGEDYTVLNDKYVKIETVPANGNVIVYARFIAGNDILKTYTNKVEIIGAIADEKEFDTSKEYIAEKDFTVSNIRLTINKTNNKNKKLNGAIFTLYEDENLTKPVEEGLVFTKLETNKVYYLKETKAPTGYKLLGKTIKVTVNNLGNITLEGYQATGSNGNYQTTIINEEIDILPNTGGPGNVYFIIIGTLTIIVSCIGYIIYHKKKGESRV